MLVNSSFFPVPEVDFEKTDIFCTCAKGFAGMQRDWKGKHFRNNKLELAWNLQTYEQDDMKGG